MSYQLLLYGVKSIIQPLINISIHLIENYNIQNLLNISIANMNLNFKFLIMLQLFFYIFNNMNYVNLQLYIS